jgi:hypothetical protein
MTVNINGIFCAAALEHLVDNIPNHVKKSFMENLGRKPDRRNQILLIELLLNGLL